MSTISGIIRLATLALSSACVQGSPRRAMA